MQEHSSITAGGTGEYVHHHSTIAAKLALFRSLFRGREDVYPRRFESRKTGKSGYQPAYANEWSCTRCCLRYNATGHGGLTRLMAHGGFLGQLSARCVCDHLDGVTGAGYA